MTTCLGPNDKPYCTDLQRDLHNCGGCGTACPDGHYCGEGQCLEGTPPPPECIPPMTSCEDPERGPRCADLRFDRFHCGSCGQVCAEGTYCFDGVCRESPPHQCPAPEITCQREGGVASCVHPQHDSNNCGGCGTACGDGTYCAQGECVQGPPPPCYPRSVCEDPDGAPICIDLQHDPNNCGACDQACPPESFCAQGQCQTGAPPPICQPPRVTCRGGDGSSYCANLAYEPYNCGGCGIVCSPGQVCNNGVCEVGSTSMCTPPLSACTIGEGSYCADLAHDRNNCGGCNVVCPDGTNCNAGQCQTGPPPTGCEPPRGFCQTPDGPMCFDFAHDRNNCGGCNSVCPDGTNCFAGQCETGPPPPTGCEPPRGFCQTPTGPVCFDFARDRQNCGSCGNLCAGEDVCNGGQCGPPAQMSCQPPTITCMPPSGPTYCADLSSDRFNCGMCGRYCPGGATCETGQCVTPLPPP